MICVDPLAARMTNINFLLTISTHFSEKRFREFINHSGERFQLTKKEMLLSFIIFLSPNGSLKNNMVIWYGNFWNCITFYLDSYRRGLKPLRRAVSDHEKGNAFILHHILVSKRESKEQYGNYFCCFFPLWSIFRRVIISKSTNYNFIINTTACKTFLADIKEWAPWTFEWGGRNCERGLQGHSRLDSAKGTLNFFRPRAHESRLIFETA